jgi:L-histidine N-alpha-methyltransferase
MQRAHIAATEHPVHIAYGRCSGRNPSDECRAVLAALRQPLPTISCKYLYDDRGSQLFEDIARLPEYYQTRTEEELLETIADDVVRIAEPCELVELGSGAGRKIRLLLDAMRHAGALRGCVLLDINEMFLRQSTHRLAAEYPEARVRGVVGDFLHDLDAVGVGRNRLVIFLAGTIGNLHPDQLPGFLGGIRSCLGHDGCFLVGLDLVKDVARLEAAYNDSAGVTAEFNRNILRVLVDRFDVGFDVDSFEHIAFYDADQRWIEMRLRAVRPTAAAVPDGGPPLEFAAGDEIRTEISCKYTRESFTTALEGTGLALSRWFTDPDGLFALALVRPV